MAMATLQNKLTDVSKITKLVNRNDVMVIDDTTGMILDKNNKIMHFAILLDTKENGYAEQCGHKKKKTSKLKENLKVVESEEEEEEEENYSENSSDEKSKKKKKEDVAKKKALMQSVICRELHIIANRIPYDHEGWYIVPIYAGQTKFAPVFVESLTKDDTYLIVQDVNLFELNKSPFDENDETWKHNCILHLKKALKDAGLDDRFQVHSVFRHNRNKNNINELIMATRSYDNAKSIRIKIGNAIRSNFYTTVGQRIYNELRNEIAEKLNVKPDKVNLFDYIEAEYDELNSKLHQKNLGEDTINRIVNYISTRKKKELDMQKIQDYLLKIVEKTSNTYIYGEENFKEISEAYGLRFIVSFALYNQISEYKKYKEIEENAEFYMVELVHKHPYWNRYFVQLHGTAEIIAAYLICNLNPAQARHASSFIRYVGLDQVIKTPSEERVITDELRRNTINAMVVSYYTALRNCRMNGEEMNVYTFHNYKPDALRNYDDYQAIENVIDNFRITADMITNDQIGEFIEDNYKSIISDKSFAERLESVAKSIDVKLVDKDGYHQATVVKRARNKSDSVTSTYINKEGKIDTRPGFGYNAMLKGKIVGVWASNIIKLGGIDKKTGLYKSPFCQIYYEARSRYENRPDLVKQLEDYENKVKGPDGSRVKKPNFHVMGRRVMCQKFLESVWIAMRTIDGLPLNGGTYSEGKLGLIHNQDYMPGVLDHPCYTKDEYKAFYGKNK